MIRVTVCALLIACACTKQNPRYCEDGSDCPNGGICDPTTHACTGGIDAAPPDARIDCTDDEECAGHCAAMICAPCTGGADCQKRSDGLIHCDVADGECVQCLSPDDCPLDAPVCENQTCAPCVEDAQCAMRADVGEIGLCVEAEGACLGNDGVLFVDEAATCDMPDGSPSNPYCEIQDAIDVATSTRNVIIVRPGDYRWIGIQDEVLTIIGKPGARIVDGPSDESRVDIEGGLADVTVRGFEIRGALSSPAAGVWCHNNARCRIERCDIGLNSRGVLAQAATEIAVHESKIHENTSGGILVASTDFEIVNNWLWGNGSGTVQFGGASLGADLTGKRVFQFNTIYSNYKDAMATSAGGVACPVPTTLTSNIFWMNATPEVGGGCLVRYSVIQGPLGMAENNTSGDPMFRTEDPFGPDLHILMGSSAVNAALPDPAVTVDLDGQLRDALPDIGADELNP